MLPTFRPRVKTGTTLDVVDGGAFSGSSPSLVVLMLVSRRFGSFSSATNVGTTTSQMCLLPACSGGDERRIGSIEFGSAASFLPSYSKCRGLRQYSTQERSSASRCSIILKRACKTEKPHDSFLNSRCFKRFEKRGTWRVYVVGTL